MKRRYKTALWLVGGWVALSIVFGLLGLVYFQKFYPDAPKANYPPAQDLATAQRQDLDHFQHYFSLNQAYAPEALAQAKSLHVQALAKAGSYSPAAFSLAIARMVALSDNGHSWVSKRYLSTTNNRLPCRLYRFDGGYHVIRARPMCAELLGARLLSIDGMPIAAVIDRMYPYALGPRNHYDQFIAPFFLESPDLLHAAGVEPARWAKARRDSAAAGSDSRLRGLRHRGRPAGGSGKLSVAPLESAGGAPSGRRMSG